MTEELRPTIRTTLITPAMAEKWLTEHNTHNRPIRQRHVDSLAGAIRRGEWRFNADPIRFDWNGTLLDGQHRLWAVVLSEEPITAVVVKDLPPEVQLTMDAGARRSLADHLRLMEWPMAGALAAALNAYWRLKNGLMRSGEKPTVGQALALLEANPNIIESVRLGLRFSQRAMKGSPAIVAALHYEMSNVDQDAADSFYEKLLSGVELGRRDPIYALRRTIQTIKHPPVMFAALIIKAWNAYREGREIDHLMWRPTGLRAEQFPEIQ